MDKKKKKSQPKIKSNLHLRNAHRKRYKFNLLIESCPALDPFVIINKYNEKSIDFANPKAVKMLNTALLMQHYDIDYWDIPEGYLCPPIPGRADYIHYMADILGGSNYGKIPTGEKIKVLDIGVGANCIYPIIGNMSYDWSFIGSDIDPIAIKSAKKIVSSNQTLKGKVEIQLQANVKDIFYGVIKKTEKVDLTICNPPFHASAEAAYKASQRKVQNLTKEKTDNPVLNFGGQNHELWCEGGEKRFIREMIRQSQKFSECCFWFSTLVSKQSNLKGIQAALKLAKAVEVKTIPMGQGNKSSRIVVWTFLNRDQQKAWKQSRWKEETK